MLVFSTNGSFNSHTVERNQESNSEAFKREMTRCSIAMGVTENSLKEHSMDIDTISKNASTFLNAIWSIVPRNFSENYRNPCWHSSDIRISKETHTLHYNSTNRTTMGPATLAHRQMGRELTQNKTLFCLPNFFIAGFPKSGTTTLDEALRNHTQIAHIQSKEPHWWTRKPLHNLDHNHLQQVVSQYLFKYSYAAKNISVHKDCITYDGSQSTLWDSNFNRTDYCAMPAVISQVLPEAKFIVVMRNPITRLYSSYLYGYTLHFNMNISKWPEKVRMDPAGNFHHYVVSVIQHFNECLLNHSLYECTNENGNPFWGMRYKLTVSIYYVHLLKWLQFYPKEQFLFLRTDDMATDPPEFLSRITNFLGLRPVSPQQARQWFKKKKNVQKSKIENPSKFVMRNETWRLLEDFYKPYNAMLADLTSDERFLWNDN